MTQPARKHTVHSAHHVDEWDDVITLCDEALGVAGLHSVTRISSGVGDFTVDALDEPYLAGLAEGGPDAVREACRSVARLVTSVNVAQDERLDEVRTGRLIRMVLHAEGGAIFCYSVVPGQHLVGFTFDRTPPGAELTEVATVNAADRAMGDLVDALRARIGLQSQNVGAFRSESVPGSGSEQTEPYVDGPRDGPGYEAIRAAVDPDDLHLVTLQASYRAELAVDHLGHPRTARFFSLISVEARRKFYRDFARELPRTVGQLGRLARSSVGGALLRGILDVEQGAIYCYRVGAGDYVVGVTLDQTQVHNADVKMARLALGLS